MDRENREVKQGERKWGEVVGQGRDKGGCECRCALQYIIIESRRALCGLYIEQLIKRCYMHQASESRLQWNHYSPAGPGRLEVCMPPARV